MLINIKTCHLHSSINHQEQLFYRALITGSFRPVNIAKFLRMGFFIEHLQNGRLQIFLKIDFLKSFANFTGKHLCWSLFLKNLQAEGLQLHKKRLRYVCFPVKLAKFLRTPFLTEHLQWLLLHLQWLRLYFFKEVQFNESHLTAISQHCYEVLISFSSWHIVWSIRSRNRLFINLFIHLSGVLYKAENWHTWSYEQYFSKHRFLDICRCDFKMIEAC